ncbi:hypothetical protein V3481_012192 [Fusarium oxysporum f. sp. vasinfectum]
MNQKTAAVGSTKKCVWRLVSLLYRHGGSGGAEIVVVQDDSPFLTPKRPRREVRPTSKVRDTARQLEDNVKETRKNTRQVTRTVPAEEQIDRRTEVPKSSATGSSSSDGRAMLQNALDLLGGSRRETKRLQEALNEQIEITRELKEAVAKQEETVHEMGKKMVEIKERTTEEVVICGLASATLLGTEVPMYQPPPKSFSFLSCRFTMRAVVFLPAQAAFLCLFAILPSTIKPSSTPPTKSKNTR